MTESVLPSAEILAIGSELLTPSKIDTNSLWLTSALNKLGVEVVSKSIVGDDRARLTESIRLAMQRSRIVIITGGLGPTEDDVTRDAVAAALDRGQSFQQDLCDAILARFARMKRPMAENNKRQAFLIDGACALPNDRGTAPGQWVEANGSVIILLPGPPREMEAMFELQCVSRLETVLPRCVIRTRFYRVAGMGESDLDQLIAPVYTPYQNPATTILAGPGDIQIHLRAQSGSEGEAESLLEKVGSRIEELLGERLYSRTGESLEEVVGALLTSRSESVATAESLTAGMIGERITRVPKSSVYFQGGFLTYTDEVKISQLGIDPALLRAHTAVSEPVAKAMAESARQRLQATWGLAVTGYAGPDGGPDGTPAGTVFVAVAGPDKTISIRLQYAPERQRVRLLTTTASLDLLRRTILRASEAK